MNLNYKSYRLSETIVQYFYSQSTNIVYNKIQIKIDFLHYFIDWRNFEHAATQNNSTTEAIAFEVVKAKTKNSNRNGSNIGEEER